MEVNVVAFGVGWEAFGQKSHLYSAGNAQLALESGFLSARVLETSHVANGAPDDVTQQKQAGKENDRHTESGLLESGVNLVVVEHHCDRPSGAAPYRGEEYVLLLAFHGDYFRVAAHAPEHLAADLVEGPVFLTDILVAHG